MCINISTTGSEEERPSPRDEHVRVTSFGVKLPLHLEPLLCCVAEAGHYGLGPGKHVSDNRELDTGTDAQWLLVG